MHAAGRSNGHRAQGEDLLVSRGVTIAVLDPMVLDTEDRPDDECAVAEDGRGKESDASVGL